MQRVRIHNWHCRYGSKPCVNAALSEIIAFDK